ncbi:MAG: LacI family transcriptional regulator [bacterium]|nr:LacI family transcriptional regulator [bacterium]
MGSRVTLKTVAERAEVSTGAVSQVLANPDHPRFSPETRVRIVNAARELGYRPNRFARALREGRSNLISLVVPGNCPEFLDEAERLTREAGQQLMVRFTQDCDAATESEALRAVIDWQADGVIWHPAGHDGTYEDAVARLRSTGTDVVLLHRGLPEFPEADVVRHDPLAGTRALVEHLAKQGYAEVNVVHYQTDAEDARQELIRQAAKRAGMAVHCIRAARDARATARLQKAFEDLAKSCAFVCIGDWLALEVIEVAQDAGLLCGRDYGMVTVGDHLVGGRHRAGTLTVPKLTAVRQASGAVAGHTVRILLAKIGREYNALVKETLIPEELVVRESTPGPGA